MPQTQDPEKLPATETEEDRRARGSGPAVSPEDRTYSPSDVEVTRARMQGAGVGAQDMDRQRDPTRARSADQFGAEAPDAPGRTAGDRARQTDE